MPVHAVRPGVADEPEAWAGEALPDRRPPRTGTPMRDSCPADDAPPATPRAAARALRRMRGIPDGGAAAGPGPSRPHAPHPSFPSSRRERRRRHPGPPARLRAVPRARGTVPRPRGRPGCRRRRSRRLLGRRDAARGGETGRDRPPLRRRGCPSSAEGRGQRRVAWRAARRPPGTSSRSPACPCAPADGSGRPGARPPTPVRLVGGPRPGRVDRHDVGAGHGRPEARADDSREPEPVPRLPVPLASARMYGSPRPGPPRCPIQLGRPGDGALIRIKPRGRAPPSPPSRGGTLLVLDRRDLAEPGRSLALDNSRGPASG